jgi:thiamine pyrophosphate-dependent acetolactate synthase large subunit-like protein
MARKTSRTEVSRRKFLAGAAVAGAATALPGVKSARAQAGASAAFVKRPSTAAAAAELAGQVPASPGTLAGPPGSDFMVDVLKSLDVDFVFSNPASSCRGIHESIVNYGGNKKPEFITCMHEESAVAMTHGYFKVAGKPAAALCHGTVGLQHAAMAAYNAWCDRAASVVMVGNRADAATRQPGVPTIHAVQDPGSLIRDFTKWDDNPQSLQHFAESMVRAYKIAMTPPHEPVLMVLEEKLQEDAMEKGKPLSIPKLNMVSPPAGDPNAVREAARLLAMADNPVIVADRVGRTPAGVKRLVELAEALNAPVVDQLGRMNMPNTHHLYQVGGAAVAQADVILGLELTDFWGTVNEMDDSAAAEQKLRIKPGAKLISIGVADLYIRANYQDFERYQSVDIAIGADAEATLPMLTEFVKQAIPAERRAMIEARGEKARKGQAAARDRMLQQAAANAWDASPISSSRLAAEMWNLIKNENWALVSRDSSISNWPHRLWTFDQHHQFIGGPGGAGIGYGLPAAVGAAFAHRAIDSTRLCVNIQNDGDSMYAPGALWTASHHKVPMLTVMWNNRAYHQEIMHLQRMANWRQRDVTTAHVGTTIWDPYIQYEKLAESLGQVGIGPITDPKDLNAALKRGIEAVKMGEPVLINVVTQPR